MHYGNGFQRPLWPSVGWVSVEYRSSPCRLAADISADMYIGWYGFVSSTLTDSKLKLVLRRRPSVGRYVGRSLPDDILRYLTFKRQYKRGRGIFGLLEQIIMIMIMIIIIIITLIVIVVIIGQYWLEKFGL